MQNGLKERLSKRNQKIRWTMRLGSYKAKSKKNSLISIIYNQINSERHRHRYEVNKLKLN